MRWGLVAGAMLIGVPLSAPAWAQGDEESAARPSAEDDKRARMLFELGDEHYRQGRYAEALTALEEAYALSGRQALLFNMANALEKLGRDEEALEKLEAYAPHAPASRREEVAARIVELKKRIEAKKPAPVPEPPPPVPVPPPPVPAPVVPTPKPGGEGAREPTPETPMMPSAMAGYALLGVGAVGIGLGAVFGGIALGARSEAEASCAGNAERQHCLTDASEALDDDARFSTAADVAFGVGIASALVGGALVIHSFVASPSSTGQALTVVVESGGLRVTGSF